MENIDGRKNKLKNKNLGLLLLVGTILLPILIATPALATQFTGCLGVSKGTLYNINAGASPLSPCSKADAIISFYDNNTVDTLQTQVTTLNNTVNTLQTQVTTLNNTVNTLQTQVTTLQSTLQYVTLTGKDIYITGANLHILSGSGSTDGAVNGLGNLIIGYNEVRVPGINNRTGSHNLILGSQNNYLSYGGLVAGSVNTISGPYSSVSGGFHNTASGYYSSTSGGYNNTASGYVASVSGGSSNTASSLEASVSGGYNNNASGWWASVSGGEQNTASGYGASVSGGYDNTASGTKASVSGGYNNTASGYGASVSGGHNSIAPAGWNWAAGTGGDPYTGYFFSNS